MAHLVVAQLVAVIGPVVGWHGLSHLVVAVAAVAVVIGPVVVAHLVVVVVIGPVVAAITRRTRAAVAITGRSSWWRSSWWRWWGCWRRSSWWRWWGRWRRWWRFCARGIDRAAHEGRWRLVVGAPGGGGDRAQSDPQGRGALAHEGAVVLRTGGAVVAQLVVVVALALAVIGAHIGAALAAVLRTRGRW